MVSSLKSLRYLALVLSIASTHAFAYSPKEPPPESERAAPVQVASRMPTDKEKFTLHSVPNSYFGINPARRGSAILGILLGPLGVAANMAYNDKEGSRQGSGLRDVLGLDLSAGLRAKLDSNPAGAPNTEASHYELIPAAM